MTADDSNLEDYRAEVQTGLARAKKVTARRPRRSKNSLETQPAHNNRTITYDRMKPWLM